MTTAAGSDHWVERWLSAPRYAVYLAATEHDRAKAIALYEWNARVASAFHHDLAHLEVGLRNAYDRALCSGMAPGQPHWVFDAERFFPPLRLRAANGRVHDANEKSRRVIAEAIRSAGQLARDPSEEPECPPPGKVIAELGFGFWRFLTAKRLNDPLWLPYLHRAFRAGTSRQDVDRPVGRLHNLRNRVAHHEPLFAIDLVGRHRDLVAVAGLMSSELAEYIRVNSDWPRLLAARPEWVRGPR